MQASGDELRLCPGIGDTKADRLQRVFSTPFQSAKQPRAAKKQAPAATASPAPDDAGAVNDIDLTGVDFDDWDADGDWEE